jgi:preprotein translocase subunit Sss1
MATLILFAPLFLAFEVVQLVLSERYLGIKQIARGADPRSLGLGELTAFFWTMAIVAYWLWMTALLFSPLSRINGLGLMAVSALGFSFRRGNPMKWTLVILTFEGAIRVGFLISLIGTVWRKI